MRVVSCSHDVELSHSFAIRTPFAMYPELPSALIELAEWAAAIALLCALVLRGRRASVLRPAIEIVAAFALGVHGLLAGSPATVVLALAWLALAVQALVALRRARARPTGSDMPLQNSDRREGRVALRLVRGGR